VAVGFTKYWEFLVWLRTVGFSTRTQLHGVSYWNAIAVGFLVKLLSTGSSSITHIRFKALPVSSKKFSEELIAYFPFTDTSGAKLYYVWISRSIKQ
jgi:hypothetical protein